MKTASSFAALALSLTGLTALLSAGCDGPSMFKMAPCQQDGDCPKRDGGANGVCYNFRCVECHYDADCPDGTMCGGQNTCDSFGARPGGSAAPALDPPKTIEECTKRCGADGPCREVCKDRFAAPKPSK